MKKRIAISLLCLALLTVPSSAAAVKERPPAAPDTLLVGAPETPPPATTPAWEETTEGFYYIEIAEPPVPVTTPEAAAQATAAPEATTQAAQAQETQPQATQTTTTHSAAAPPATTARPVGVYNSMGSVSLVSDPDTAISVAWPGLEQGEPMTVPIRKITIDGIEFYFQPDAFYNGWGFFLNVYTYNKNGSYQRLQTIASYEPDSRGIYWIDILMPYTRHYRPVEDGVEQWAVVDGTYRFCLITEGIDRGYIGAARQNLMYIYEYGDHCMWYYDVSTGQFERYIRPTEEIIG